MTFSPETPPVTIDELQGLEGRNVSMRESLLEYTGQITRPSARNAFLVGVNCGMGVSSMRGQLALEKL